VNKFEANIDLERARRLRVFGKADEQAFIDWEEAVSGMGEPAGSDLARAFDFARLLKYRHSGLSSSAYFSHPVRVASMALTMDSEATPENGIVGILHNVLEVSDTSVSEIGTIFGQDIAAQIDDLTVDRARQWNPDYKQDYYRKLNNGPRPARVVKILDKLDNLYLLCLNPDAKIRDMYLQEIKKHLFAMVHSTMPGLSDYFQDLTLNCIKTGYLESSDNHNSKDSTP
jgi:(p)ppGpp synthase/HD superfamily hydrolase